MKWTFIIKSNLIPVFILGLIIGTLIPASAAEKTFSVKWTTYEPDSRATNLIFDVFDIINKRSGNRFNFKLYYASSLCGPKDAPDFVKKNIAQGGLMAPGYRPDLFPLSRAFELLYISRSNSAKARAFMELYETYPPLRAEWDNLGVKPMYPIIFSLMPYCSSKPAYKWEDFKGMKFRAYGSHATLISRWGGEPISLPWEEQYEALSRGLVDGITTIDMAFIYAQKLHEVVPYFIDHGAGTYPMVIHSWSIKFLKSLPKELQDIIDGMRKEAIDVNLKGYLSELDRQCELLAAFPKVVPIRWTPEEMKRGEQQAIPYVHEAYFNEMKKRGLEKESTELYDLIVKLTNKYEASHPLKKDAFEMIAKERRK